MRASGGDRAAGDRVRTPDGRLVPVQFASLIVGYTLGMCLSSRFVMMMMMVVVSFSFLLYQSSPVPSTTAAWRPLIGLGQFQLPTLWFWFSSTIFNGPIPFRNRVHKAMTFLKNTATKKNGYKSFGGSKYCNDIISSAICLFRHPFGWRLDANLHPIVR